MQDELRSSAFQLIGERENVERPEWLLSEIPEWLPPRWWFAIPIIALLIGAGPMLTILTLLELASYVRVLHKDSIPAGALVVWTALMICIAIEKYAGGRWDWQAAGWRWAGSAADWLVATHARARRLISRRRRRDIAAMSGWRARARAAPAPGLGKTVDRSAATAVEHAQELNEEAQGTESVLCASLFPLCPLRDTVLGIAHGTGKKRYEC